MIAFLFVGCPYKAKGVVLYAPVFYSSILKGIISPVWFGSRWSV